VDQLGRIKVTKVKPPLLAASFASLMSAVGPNPKTKTDAAMSALWGEPDTAGAVLDRRLRPEAAIKASISITVDLRPLRPAFNY
jgi:hypothetical protein